MTDRQTIEIVVDNIADQDWPGRKFAGVYIPPVGHTAAATEERRAALTLVGNQIKPADGVAYIHPSDGGVIGFPELMRGLQAVDRILAEVEGLDAAVIEGLKRLRHLLADELVGGSESQLEPEPLLAMARTYAALGLEQEADHG